MKQKTKNLGNMYVGYFMEGKRPTALLKRTIVSAHLHGDKYDAFDNMNLLEWDTVVPRVTHCKEADKAGERILNPNDVRYFVRTPTLVQVTDEVNKYTLKVFCDGTHLLAYPVNATGIMSESDQEEVQAYDKGKQAFVSTLQKILQELLAARKDMYPASDMKTSVEFVNKFGVMLNIDGEVKVDYKLTMECFNGIVDFKAKYAITKLKAQKTTVLVTLANAGSMTMIGMVMPRIR